MPDQPTLEVCLSPALLPIFDTRDKIVVIIDIFRATSTISAALDNGAAAVIPVATVEECLEVHAQNPALVTAGERDGQVIPGLQYGNSPLDYQADFIAGKTLALTTTNGTRLLHMVQGADTIITGSFLNLSAVCAYLLGAGKNVLLACAAWKDRVNMEDTLFAGAVVARLQSRFELACDSSRIALALYDAASEAPSLLAFMENSSHYKRLAGFGLIGDMEYCMTLDKHPVVPEYTGEALVPAKALNVA